MPALGSGLLKPDLHIFRRIGHGKVRGRYMRDEALSYGRVRELVRELLVNIGLNLVIMACIVSDLVLPLMPLTSLV